MEDIEALHLRANEDKLRYYIDPPTRYKVIPSHVHITRGSCCGNMCRHCPYGWAKVKAIPETEKLETWRSRATGNPDEIPMEEKTKI
jgi:hypothetical protein